MRIFNEGKTEELQAPDLNLGFLKEDKLFIAHHEAEEADDGEFHIEVLKEYKRTVKEHVLDENGELPTDPEKIVYEEKEILVGRDIKRIWDRLPHPAREAYDEYEDILTYVPYTAEELRDRKIAELQKKREDACFPVINRGQLWYDRLTEEQLTELADWYQAWCDVTEPLKAFNGGKDALIAIINTIEEPEAPAWINQKLNENEVF